MPRSCPPCSGLGGWDSLAWPAQVHLPSLAFGLGSLAALMLARRWRPGFPTVLAVVVASAGISYFTGFEAGGGAVVGALPQGLPMPYLPGWPGWSVLGQLVLPTLVITLVSFLETASSAKVDSGQRGQRWDQDQDLIGQGLAKLASGLSGAFPTSSSFSRSALNLYAGARTGWATVFSVVVVLVALLVLTPLLHHVPMAVLAAIVLVAILGLIKPRAFVHLWRVSRVEAGIAGITFAVTLLAAPRLYWGVLAGVLMALSPFPVPAAAPAHHRGGPAPRRQPARPPPLAAAAAGAPPVRAAHGRRARLRHRQRLRARDRRAHRAPTRTRAM